MASLMSSFRLFASRRGVALPNLLLQRSLVTGNVKWFNTTKGFGFIAARNEEGQEVDYFVHQSSILMDGYRFLEEGEQVEFDIANPTAGRGPTATNVKSLSPNKKNIRPPLRQGDGGQGRSGGGSFGKRDGGGFRSRGGNDRGRRREGEEDDF